MGEALIYGLIASSALVLGSLLGLRGRLPRHLEATILAFAGGALTAAMAYELFGDAFEIGGTGLAASGLLAGAALFIVVDAYLVKHLRKRATGPALLAGAIIDGVPENLALGTALATGGGSLALLVAIFVSNFPEALAGTADMPSHRSRSRIFLAWCVAAVFLVIPTLAGYALLQDAQPAVVAATEAFAGGAVLALVANSILPEAYREGGPWVAFATVAGFLVSFMLSPR